MAARMTAPSTSRRRLSPEARREQILTAARALFAERPYATVTTAEVAAAAGVTRSLVHHYFGGIRELFLAVVAQGADALTDVRTAGPETPLDERLAHNVAAGLDVIEANRETWLAVTLGLAQADEDVRRIAELARNRSVQRALAMGEATVGWASTQASATAATDTSCVAAISSSASRTAYPRSLA